MSEKNLHTEKELLLQMARGDESSFRQLFTIYKDAVYSAAYRWLESSSQSEDIVQDVFLKLWQIRATLPKVENIKVYLLVATKNHVFNAFKKNARTTALLKEMGNIGETKKDITTELLDYKETFILLQQAVNHLPPQQRKVFTLGKLEGYKLEDIAAHMSLSLVTINKHMALAIQSVKNYLAAHNNPFRLAVLSFLFHQL